MQIFILGDAEILSETDGFDADADEDGHDDGQDDEVELEAVDGSGHQEAERGRQHQQEAQMESGTGFHLIQTSRKKPLFSLRKHFFTT